MQKVARRKEYQTRLQSNMTYLPSKIWHKDLRPKWYCSYPKAQYQLVSGITKQTFLQSCRRQSHVPRWLRLCWHEIKYPINEEVRTRAEASPDLLLAMLDRAYKHQNIELNQPGKKSIENGTTPITQNMTQRLDIQKTYSQTAKPNLSSTLKRRQLHKHWIS